MIYGFIAVFVAYAILAGMDIHITNKGILANVSVEGNPMIVAIFGDKPSLLELVAFEAMWGVPIGFMCLFGALHGIPGVWGAFGGGLIGLAARHVQGYFAWRKLIGSK